MAETMDKSYFEHRRLELDSAYNAVKPDWQELSEFYMPRSVRFLVQNVNKKLEKNKKIKDSAPLKAVRNFSSGMMSGATNPATNWFRLKIKNDYLRDDFAVRSWCGDVEQVFKTELYPKKWTKNPLVYDRLKRKGYRE